MKCRITKEHVWGGALDDRPGALADKLAALRDGGLDLELIIARRDWSGVGLLFISPLRTLAELETAERAGLTRDQTITTLRIEAPNRLGLGARIAGALAEAGVNPQSYSALALGDKSVTNIAFDNDNDSRRAREVLEAMFAAWEE